MTSVGLSDVSAQKVRGNGNVIRQTRDVTPFTSLNIGGVFNIFLSQSNQEKLMIEADENLLEYIETSVRGGELYIEMDDVEIKESKKLNIYITFKDIDAMNIHGVNTVTSEQKLTFDELDIERAGVGNTELELDCNYLFVHSSSVGTIKLSGKAEEVKLRNSGVGSIKAKDLITQKLELNNSGIGSVSVYADETIEINSSGIGSVTYSGNAKVNKLNASGIGKVKKK